MRHRRLGSDAPEVSAIGFGGMPLSIQGRPRDGAVGPRVIHAALDGGMTLIDTADVYCLDDSDIGHNERLIAAALRTWSGPRDSIIVATKGGLTRPGGRWECDARPQHLRRACERSLRALGVEQIALYQLHAPDPAVPFADSVGELARLRTEGKIRWVGLSNVSVEEIGEAEAIVPVTSVQNRLSPFFRESLEDGVLDYCARKGIGFIAYSPAGGGRLHNKLPSHQVLKPIAERHGASCHAVVYAWLHSLAPNVIPIPGARTEAHAADSATAAELELTAEELRAIERASFSRA
jgi:aryl-alcohol dehydrogenase-like predicted oxidoreductase